MEGYPGFAPGDLMEISPKDDNVPEEERLLLKVPPISSPQPMVVHHGLIYIDQVIAKSFRLTPRCEVNVIKVDKTKVTLDSVELMFKHQYLSRSVMWRMKSYLVNECVHLNKQISFAGINCSVFEMWRAGVKTFSGLIGPETKIVFRSASSQIFIFLQMSSEMWDFDINGDLYFEKAVTGFLADLFKKWNQLKCTHDVTIVMFSRTFYKAEEINEFPEKMKGSLQQDYKGRFYEDFYRVVVQNERYEDWGPVLALLMRLFNEYEKEVVRFHESDASGHGQRLQKVPKAYNSTSSQGNFLEVLNISLNVFDKHNVDRSFDRTGQLSIVISPGVGVFEVEFDLTNLTKQRIIDNGIGSDLVCLGEQPLHAVPLFKFHCKDDSNSYSLDAADVYNMPHWINLSYYMSPVQTGPSTFIPRIKMPKIVKSSSNASSPMTKYPLKNLYTRSQSRDQVAANTLATNGSIHSITLGSGGISNGTNVNTYSNNGRHGVVMIPLDYEEYDAQIFKPSQPCTLTSTAAPAPRRRKSVINDRHPHTLVTASGHAAIMEKAPRQRRSSEYCITSNIDHSNDSINESSSKVPSSVALTVPTVHNSKLLRPSSPVFNCASVGGNGTIVSSSSAGDSGFSSNTFGCGSYPPSKYMLPKFHAYDDLTLVSNSPKLNRSGHRPKALINPFDPSQITIKLTSNRRRWTHVFPLDASGIFMQQHHYQAVPAGQIGNGTTNNNNGPCLDNHNQNKSETIMVPVASTPTQMRKVSTSISNDYSINSRKFTSDELLSKNSHLSPRTSASNDADGKNSSNHRSSIRVVETRSDTMTYAWGATGEQEWTPAITTTMDWKSLVMPACLPITTDFFPDAVSASTCFNRVL